MMEMVEHDVEEPANLSITVEVLKALYVCQANYFGALAYGLKNILLFKNSFPYVVWRTEEFCGRVLNICKKRVAVQHLTSLIALLAFY